MISFYTPWYHQSNTQGCHHRWGLGIRAPPLFEEEFNGCPTTISCLLKPWYCKIAFDPETMKEVISFLSTSFRCNYLKDIIPLLDNGIERNFEQDMRVYNNFRLRHPILLFNFSLLQGIFINFITQYPQTTLNRNKSASNKNFKEWKSMYQGFKIYIVWKF